MINYPQVSIAIATYNGEKNLEKQLDSIYNQTYKNIEVIVTDDGSTDGTIEILEQYRKSYGLKYFVNEKNLGFIKNFEKAMSLCNGDFIALSDQDDIWLPTKLEILMHEIGNALLVCSDCMLIDENGDVLQDYWHSDKPLHDNYVSFEYFLFNNYVTGCTTLLKKELFLNASPFPETEIYHDWNLAFNAVRLSSNAIKYVPKSLVQYRQHSKQDTGAKQHSIFYCTVVDLFNRVMKKQSARIINNSKQLKRLQSYKQRYTFSDEQVQVLDDAINYYHFYLKSFFHLKAFMISLKYSRYIYPRNNRYYLLNIVRDIVG